MASSIDIEYGYEAGAGQAQAAGDTAYDSITDGVKAALVGAFAGPPDTGVRSLGVQQTVLEMCQAALAAVPQVADISIHAPNLHNIPFNFTSY